MLRIFWVWSLGIGDLKLDSVREFFLFFFEFRISELNTNNWSLVVAAVVSQVNT